MAIDQDDALIISAACQDALFLAKNAKYSIKARRFTMQLQRFCHEDEQNGKRVYSLLSFDGVLGVAMKNISPQSNVPKSILSLNFIPDKVSPAGRFIIEMADNSQLAINVECIDLVLGDIGDTRDAKSRPNHELS